MRTSLILIAAATVTLTLVVGMERCGPPSRTDAITVLAPFEQPNAAARREALGTLDEFVPVGLRAALAVEGGFRPIPAPGPSDWLSSHAEPGQTFSQFLAARRNRPDRIRNVIYLQPLVRVGGPDAPPIEFLRRFAQAYFGMSVVVQPPAPLSGDEITERPSTSEAPRQLLTTDILRLLSRELPPDAFCRLGLTMEDLYAGNDWNFVFGQATLSARVGVYSFARYSSQPKSASVPGTRAPLMRGSKVLAHETGHMFGLLHCVYYACLMNGSNHLAELDAVPLHLCPVCLRKLQNATRFDALDRYKQLRGVCLEAGFDDEGAWLHSQIRAIEAVSPHHPTGPV